MSDMRKDFEATFPNLYFNRLGEDYKFPATQYHWAGYQAGRASAALQALSDAGQELQPEYYAAAQVGKP